MTAPAARAMFSSFAPERVAFVITPRNASPWIFYSPPTPACRSDTALIRSGSMKVSFFLFSGRSDCIGPDWKPSLNFNNERGVGGNNFETTEFYGLMQLAQ